MARHLIRKIFIHGTLGNKTKSDGSITGVRVAVLSQLKLNQKSDLLIIQGISLV